QGNVTNPPEEISEKTLVHDYSKSGYIIAKGKDEAGKCYYLLFKNAHDSAYHRHDDDLAIFLYYDGEILLGDGGLGSHMETDERRIILRSAKSHSTCYVESLKAERRVSHLPQRPKTMLKDLVVEGTSYCYGIPIHRRVDLREICNG